MLRWVRSKSRGKELAVGAPRCCIAARSLQHNPFHRQQRLAAPLTICGSVSVHWQRPCSQVAEKRLFISSIPVHRQWRRKFHQGLRQTRTNSVMVFPINVAEKIRFFQPTCPHVFWLRGRFYRASSLSCRLRQGLSEAGLSSTENQRQGSRRTCWERFVGKMQNYVTNAGTTKMGMVLPANELHVEEAVRVLKSGQVIAVPTDTLYGLACDACSMDAVNRIYEIKGRKLASPLAICVGKVSDICRFADTENLPNDLLESLLPGPVTVVLLRGDSSILEESLNPGLDSIGIRVPDAKFIQAVAQGFGSAVALTSANLSGQPSSVDIKDFEDLWPLCSHIYDGGQLPVGRSGSTIVDLTKPGKYRILRPGSALEETGNILRRFNLKEVV